MSRHDPTEGYANEPIRGLPGLLPAGEHIIWQGSPDWKRLALTAFHARGVAFYFALLVGWALLSGASLAGVLATAGAGLLALAVLAGLAYWSARASIYTLTNRRIVLRIGAALPTCINVPLKIVRNAALKLHADGTGDIPLELGGRERVGYAMLWPHARPWKFGDPQPMLRAVPEGEAVAALIARTLAEAVPEGRRLVAGDAEAGPALRPVGKVQAA
ncbi:MAG: photosynthetic complex putative assembly protein PuhB [Sphingomonadaceae bacterium]